MKLSALSPCSMAVARAEDYSPDFETDDSSQNSEKDYEGSDKKLRRREKNRIAAQKSRQKQTQRADILHQEYEQLERENTLLRKEVQTLREELKQWTAVVHQHEPLCAASAAMPSAGTTLPAKAQLALTDYHPNSWRETETLKF